METNWVKKEKLEEKNVWNVGKAQSGALNERWWSDSEVTWTKSEDFEENQEVKI